MKIIRSLTALRAVALIALVVLANLGAYYYIKYGERSVPFTLLNDTNEAVKVIACAGGDEGPKPPIEPNKIDTYYAYPSDPNAACGFYEVKTDKYMGCLPTPVTQGKKDTFRVSEADTDIEYDDCGLGRS